MVYVTVYGTLKKGHHNHKIHLDREPDFAGRVKIKAEMYSNGRYPMLIKSKTKNSIYIEVYEISKHELEKIDKLEEPFDYHRELINVKEFESWIYYYTPNTVPEGFAKVPNGNFVKEREW